jgi:aminopeptidase YwaD
MPQNNLISYCIEQLHKIFLSEQLMCLVAKSLRNTKFCLQFGLLWLCINNTAVYAQDKAYARSIIDTLSSPAMHGRGYVREGDKLAARYISREFKHWGLNFLGLDYYQPFAIDAVVYPNCMDFAIDNKYLLAGVDYQITPGSGGIEGKYKVVRIKERDLLDAKRFEKLQKQSFEGKILQLCYTEKFPDSLRQRLEQFKQSAKAAAYIVPVFGKMTWHIATEPIYYSEIQLKATYFDKAFATATCKIEAEYLQKYDTRNIIGYIEGSAEPDSMIAFTAHYDHLGRMGADTYIPGANDNASGIAMLLNLAKYYSQNPPPYTVLFIAFSGEELGLLGSQHFVNNSPFDLQKIKFLINTDIVGTGDEGITVVNATEFPEQFKWLQQINDAKQYLPKIKQRGKAANSDHYPFYARQVPCFFIYTMGGIKAYHDIYDRPATLPLTKFEQLHQLLTEFVAHFSPF